MSANSLDRRPGIDSLATKINELERMIRELRTTQPQGESALNPDKTTGLSTSWTLLNNQRGIATYTLANNDGKMVFGVPEFTFYEDSIGLGNEIGYGYPRDNNYECDHWIDWGSSDGNNMVLKCWIVNKSGSTKNIEAVCDWRFVVSSSSHSSIT